MTLAEALDVVVARTGHARYRDLCDPHHPAFHPAYVALVLRLAGGVEESVPALDPPAPPRRPVPTIWDLLARMRTCSHRAERTDCGCGGLATCALGKGHGGLVNHEDCMSCLDSKS